MTKIDFYSGADDKQERACELCQKAVASGARVLIFTADEAATTAMDNLLWAHPATAFTPHCCRKDPAEYEMPIVVGHQTSDLPHYEVVINLQATCLPFFSRFERVIEVVGTDPADVGAGRERFSFYRDRGYEINHQDLGKPAGNA